MKTGKILKKLPYRLQSRVIRNHKSKNNNKKLMEEKEISKEQHLKQLEQTFRQGLQEYINLFKCSPEAQVYTNIDGIVMHVNRSFEDLTGYREDELRGNALVYCLKPEEKSLFETDSREYFETIINGKHNSRIEVLVNKDFNQTENRLAGIIFSFRDIYRRRRERKINKTLYYISQLASSGIPLQEMYPLIHQQLGRIIDTTNFYIALSGPAQGQLRFPYYTDRAAGEDEIFIYRYCTSQSIFHYIIKTGKPVLMDYQRYRKMLSYGYIEPWDVMTNTHLWLGVPLKINKQLIGVIALQSYDNARLYSEKDIDLLEYVSQQISGAIYRKEMEEKLAGFSQEQADSDNMERIPVTDRSTMQVMKKIENNRGDEIGQY